MIHLFLSEASNIEAAIRVNSTHASLLLSNISRRLMMVISPYSTASTNASYILSTIAVLFPWNANHMCAKED